MPVSLLFLCVNYADDANTLALISSVRDQTAADHVAIIVVDNTERSKSTGRLKTELAGASRVTLLEPKTNLGYFGGAAWGLEQYRATHANLPEWLILSNPDIIIPAPDFLEQLLARGAGHAHAVIAPSIRSAVTGQELGVFMARRPSPWQIRMYKYLFRFYPTLLLYETLSLMNNRLAKLWHRLKTIPQSPAPPAAIRPIYAPHGSFIIFRKTYFASGGSLQYGAFLFGEELFIGESARHLNLTVAYDPALVVIHKEHAVTGFFRSRAMARYQRESAAFGADVLFKNG